MIKERIVKLIELKGVAKEKFFQKIGMTSANFRGSAKNTPLNSNAIENILSEFPDVNLEWLISGKGSMLKSDTQALNVNSTSSKHNGKSAANEPHNCIYKELLKEKEEEIKNLNREIGELQEQLRSEKKAAYERLPRVVSGESAHIEEIKHDTVPA